MMTEGPKLEKSSQAWCLVLGDVSSAEAAKGSMPMERVRKEVGEVGGG